ncbi:DEAD/DEAH box helicase [Geobacter sp. DSM 9736]|uniref:DEAD/DEAH box helicase n=1 Tax=Geobacter sp. DSM 9736 TaxID=1277350 RepID=UPI000B5FE1A0|nr:DEAD/DEAH box helicase [Geobacter sp. DSM 9736]SNB46225.1 Superfamily II DNA and RNA helicase [Geobacter sp. DSM 9736]
MAFEQFNLDKRVMEGVRKAGYTSPTPIQERGIPAVLAGGDIMGLAQTGTGKTAAFLLPILQRLLKGERRRVRALVVAPTRELAAQIDEAANTLGAATGLRSTALFGGVNIKRQIEEIRKGVEIVVACPGRLLDHIGQGTIDLSHIEVLVLDEADQMFDMGFFPDIRRILKHLPAKRQTLLFSATMPDEIRKLASEVLHSPKAIQVGRTAPAVTVSHAIYPVAQHLKTPLLLELLKKNDGESILVFTRTKHRAKRLHEQLSKAGHKATSLQGNLSQNRRQEAMEGFRNGTYRILAATDIAARGIDVSQISHVINYDIPDTPETYIHRIGRTGRAARTGDAFTFVTTDDTAMVKSIERLLGSAIERRMVEEFDYSAPAPEVTQAPRTARPPRAAKGPAQKEGGPRRQPHAPETKHGSVKPRGTRRTSPRKQG